MTDSTINTNSSDGSLDVGGTADELFGEIDEGMPEGEPVDVESADDDASTDGETEPSDGGVEDQTAAAVFGNLQQSVSSSDDIDAVLDDESPEDIIASADDPEPESTDDDLLVDEGALEELLLTDRTKDQEFLWVDADESETEIDAEASPESETVETETDAKAVDTETDVSGDGLAETDAPESAAASSSSDETPDENAPTAATSDGREEPATTDTVEPNEESDADPSDETAATTDIALVDDDQSGVPAPAADDDDHAGGFLGWLRSKLGRLFP